MLIVLIKHVYEPEYITGPSGVIPIAVLKVESIVDVSVLVFSYYIRNLIRILTLTRIIFFVKKKEV